MLGDHFRLARDPLRAIDERTYQVDSLGPFSPINSLLDNLGEKTDNPR